MSPGITNISKKLKQSKKGTCLVSADGELILKSIMTIRM